MRTAKLCFQCGNKGTELYGYIICDSCKRKLRLLTDQVIAKQSALYSNPIKKHSYADEIRGRLNYIDKKHIEQRIKLLHVLERLDNLNG